MKNIKWIMIVLGVILIILIVAVAIMLSSTNDNQNNEIGDVGLVEDYENNQIEEVTNSTNFYTVSNVINQYLDIINSNNSIYYGYDENNNYAKIVSDEQIATNVYGLLSENYITVNNITESNVFDFVDSITEDVIFLPTRMNVLERENVQIYSVYGIEYTLNNTYLKDAYFIVTLDRNNSTFSIEPLDNEYSSIDDIELQNNNDISIEATSYNTYTETSVSYEDVAKNYIYSYKTLALVKPDMAYNLLDEEYRNQKFGSLENFESYVNDNRQTIQQINLQQYQVNNYDDYIQYVMIDQNDKYYIFNEAAVMDYTLMLDTYTIDLPEFTEKYNSGTDQVKVGMNLEKVFSAINDGDYEYVYNKLDSTFRQNNFPTLSDFENYIAENLYTSIDVAYGEYQTSGNLHVYEVNIKEKNNENSNTITKNFIMQLGEGTDFVMSFNV